MISWLLKRFGKLMSVLILSLIISISSGTITFFISIFMIEHINVGGMTISFVLPFFLAFPLLYLETNTISELWKAQEQLEILATTDTLTGIPNRAHFFSLAEQSLMHAPPVQPVSLAIIDIDRFKLINDHYGHLAGDQALKNIAQTVKVHVRPDDIFGRFAGDEFILLCPNTTESEMQELARHLLKHVQTLSIGEVETKTRLSATMGVTTAIPAMAALRDLISKADHALLEAKREGGNRVRYS